MAGETADVSIALETADVSIALETADVSIALETADVLAGELVEAIQDQLGANIEDQAGGILLQQYD